jgi:arginine decarboxylase
VLVFDVLGAGGLPRAVPAPAGEEALILRNLRDTHAAISAIPADDAAAIGAGLERLQEAWNDALKFKDDAMAAFRLGYLGLPERGLAEQLTWACCQGIAERLALLPADAPVPDELRALPAALASTYYANLSVFRSAPDTWAIDQLFPLLPLQRLDEPPSRLGSFADLTCDSDGKLARFINPDGRSGRGQVKTLLELHPLHAGEPYWVGLFLAGAYQEVMGNLHNLFGSTDSVHIRLAPGGGYRVDHVVRGDTNAEVLQAMEHDPQLLLERLRMASETAIAQGQLAIGDARRLMDHLETSLRQTTYLQG